MSAGAPAAINGDSATRTAMPGKPITWICVADAGHARIKQWAAPAADLASVTTIRHDGAYEHGRHEGPGKTQESATTARHSFTDAEGPIRREKREFARAVAAYLNAGAKRRAYQRLVLAAPPRFLGEIRAALADAAQKRVVGELPKDLTKLSDAALKRRVAEFGRA
jgi:protein required for attachment to host cells